jgi:phage terminase large subunit-like protein
MEKRANQGNLIFSREILCKPVTNESSIFPMHVIQRSYVGMQDYTFVRSKDAYKQKFDRIVMSCDFSISANVGADYSVFFVAGIDSNEVIWLMHMTRFKGKTFSEQIGTIKSLNHSFQPDIIVMENNVFQQIFVQESDKLGMPVIGHTTTASSKNNLEFGLPGLALLYERGKMRCPRGNQESIDIADTIENELSSVTWTDKGIQGTSEHDDCAMSLFLLSIAARKATTGFSFKFL